MKTNCPHCGRVNDHHRGDSTDKKPEAGDVSLCWKCGGASLFTEDGGVRKPTPEEDVEISQDPDVKKFRYAMAESFTPSEAIRMVSGSD